MSWGDQTTGRVPRHLLRREYGTFRLGVQDKGRRLPNAGRWRLRLRGLPGFFSGSDPFSPSPAYVGAAAGARERSPGAGSGVLFFVIVFNSIANGSLEPGVSRFVEGRFWQQPHLLVCAFAGLGLAGLSVRLGPAARLGLPAAAVALAVTQPRFISADRTRVARRRFAGSCRPISIRSPGLSAP